MGFCVSIRYTDTHQALLAMRTCTWTAVLYDGQNDATLYKNAEAACKAVAKAYQPVFPKKLGHNFLLIFV